MNNREISPFDFAFSLTRIWFRYICIFAGMAGVFYSLYAESTVNEATKTLWLVDTSLSMVVQDVEGPGGRLYSRLDLAKMLVLSGRSLIPGQHALMIFGEDARLILPFSDEMPVFEASARGLEPVLYNSPTDITTALAAVHTLYGNTPLHLIVLTDGEETTSHALSGTWVDLSNTDITFIGIGTEAWGPMLQWYDAGGVPRYKQYEGKNAISQLDGENLEILRTTYDGKLSLIHTTENIDNTVTSLGSSYSDLSFGDNRNILILGVISLIFWLMLPPFSTRKP